MQKVFTKFRDPVQSFPLREAMLGPLKPGRYNGFRDMQEVAGLNINLAHSDSVKKTLINGDYIEFGAIISPNGSIIHEDSMIPLTIVSNSANTNQRVDYVICEHEYLEIVGGQPATYLVIQGPNDGTEPVVPNPYKQVLIGKIKINPLGYQFSDLTWEPTDTPLNGDMDSDQLYHYLENLVESSLPDATETIKGKIRIATIAEVIARTSNSVALTPANILNMNVSENLKGITKVSTDLEVKTATDNTSIITPLKLRKFTGLRDYVEISDSTPLNLTDDHDGQVLVITSTGVSAFEITVSLNLRAGFNCLILNPNRIVRLIKPNGVTLYTKPSMAYETKTVGSWLWLQGMMQNTYTIMGDLKESISATLIAVNRTPRDSSSWNLEYIFVTQGANLGSSINLEWALNQSDMVNKTGSYTPTVFNTTGSPKTITIYNNLIQTLFRVTLIQNGIEYHSNVISSTEIADPLNLDVVINDFDFPVPITVGNNWNYLANSKAINGDRLYSNLTQDGSIDVINVKFTDYNVGSVDARQYITIGGSNMVIGSNYNPDNGIVVWGNKPDQSIPAGNRVIGFKYILTLKNNATNTNSVTPEMTCTVQVTQ